MLVSLLLTQLALAQDAPSGMWNASATLEPRSGSAMTGLVTFTQPMSGSGPTGPGTPGTNGTPGTAPEGANPPGQPGATPGGMIPGQGSAAGNPMAPIQVAIRLVNAAPGNHAVFLHQNGDCSAPDASSAGDFYGGMLPSPGAAPSDRPGSIGTPATPGSGGGMPGGGMPGGGMPGHDMSGGDMPGHGSASPSPGAAPQPGGGTPGTAMANPPPGYLGFVTVGAEGRGEKDLTLNGYTLEPGGASLIDRAVVVYERAPDFTAGETGGARQACGVIRMRQETPVGTE